MSFMFTTLPPAWTPASVRAALAREIFTGSSALSSDTAPDFTNALKRTPSMVLTLGWLIFLYISRSRNRLELVLTFASQRSRSQKSL